jgi:hypothetical protein
MIIHFVFIKFTTTPAPGYAHINFGFPYLAANTLLFMSLGRMRFDIPFLLLNKPGI